MLLLLGALTLGAAVFLVAEAATVPARQRRELLRRVVTYGERSAPSTKGRERAHSHPRSLTPLLAAAGSFVVRLTPTKTRENAGKRLLSAGLAKSLSPEELLGAKGLLAVAGTMFGLFLGSLLAAATAILFGLCFGALGFLGPDLFVNSRIRQRREIVMVALPDALDLLAVSVEAGLGFDGALAKLTEYMEGPLIEEFALTLSEMRIGESRIEALKRMASRVDVPELSSFVRTVVQADQLGTSMAGILRVQAADARLRRQLAAEEKAMKAPIKMLVPMAIFILPALFILILGPALLNFGKF